MSVRAVVLERKKTPRDAGSSYSALWPCVSSWPSSLTSVASVNFGSFNEVIKRETASSGVNQLIAGEQGASRIGDASIRMPCMVAQDLPTSCCMRVDSGSIDEEGMKTSTQLKMIRGFIVAVSWRRAGPRQGILHLWAARVGSGNGRVSLNEANRFVGTASNR